MPNPTLEQVLNTNNPISLMGATDLNSIASGSAVLGTVVTSNVPGDAQGCGMPYARLKLHLDSQVVSAGGVVDGWFVTAADGSVYTSEDASHIPNRPPDFVFNPWVGTAALNYETVALMPICANIKVLVRNNALGAAFAAANGTLKAYYFTDSYPSGQT